MNENPQVLPVAQADAHAKVSASGSKKWLICTPSAELEAQFKDEASPFSAEGQLAHDVGELRLLHFLGRITDQEFEVRHAALQQDPLWSEELSQYVQLYVDFAKEQIAEARAQCKDPAIFVEEKLDLRVYIPHGFGTADLLIVQDGLLLVFDYKHGKGVFVEAKRNSQTRIYGLGALTAYAHLYDIKTVRLFICQPRLDNFGFEELSVKELLAWGHGYVVPQAKLAWEGKGMFIPGDHCTKGFCKARYTCAARAQVGMQIAREAFAGVRPELLTTEQLVAVLDKADIAAKWLSDVRDYALKLAREGVAIPRFKLVPGKSQRRYSDADKVAARLIEAGIDSALLYERSLLGITGMERMLGKKRFNELLAGLIDKPEGPPTLVAESDPRPALEMNFGFSVLTDDGSCDRFAAITHQE